MAHVLIHAATVALSVPRDMSDGQRLAMMERDDLIYRAATAMTQRARRKGGGTPFLANLAVEVHAGLTYVTWRERDDLVAVYRVRRDGKLKHLVRWPQQAGRAMPNMDGAMSTLTLRQEALRVYEDLGLGDDAISELADLILADPDFRRETVLFGAKEFLYAAKRSTRVPAAPKPSPRGHGGATAEDIDLITGKPPRAATWRLWNDRALRDASRKEIEKKIEIHEAQMRRGMCENCGHPVPAEGVTLSVRRDIDRTGAHRPRCAGTACVSSEGRS